MDGKSKEMLKIKVKEKKFAVSLLNEYQNLQGHNATEFFIVIGSIEIYNSVRHRSLLNM